MENTNKELELFSTMNEFEIVQVINVLKDNQIPFIRRDDGSGSYMNIYMGQSIQFKRIFVRKQDYNKATELISDIIYDTTDESSEQEKYTEYVEKQEEEESTDKYNRLKRISIFVIVGIPVCIFIVLLINVLMFNILNLG